MGKVAERAPAATTTVEGTETEEDELDSCTAVAAATLVSSVTVPVARAPPTTLAGLIDKPVNRSGVTVIVAVFVTPAYLAVIVTA
jgi:hypothetical protein